jgi:hypothetical protein
MSTLKTNTIQHLTSGFNNVVQFVDGAGTQNGTLCRAWVNFNGTSTVAIRAQFNVTSITDNNTGDYTVNFSNAMSDANYGVSFGGGKSLDDTSSSGYICVPYPVTRNTTSVRLYNSSPTSGIVQDSPFLSISVFR